jgi:recombination protein RecA
MSFFATYNKIYYRGIFINGSFKPDMFSDIRQPDICLHDDIQTTGRQEMADSTSGNKGRAVEAAISQIQKQFGKGALMRLGDRTVEDVPVISTGSIAVDIATGIGGIPRGRIIEVYGPESSGKTTLALHIIAEAQKVGGIAAFIDAEHAMDPVYAANLGVRTDDLLISQPDYGEQALEIVDSLVRSGAIDVIVVDSVAALVPKAEIEGEMGDQHVGLQARLMSHAMRKLAGNLNRSGTALLFINQLRMKIGVMFGNPETTTGGNALKFYSTMRFDIRRIASLKEGSDVIGNRTRIKVVKNKIAPPFKQAEFDIYYGEGISREGSLIDLAVAVDIIDKSGAWYSYNGERLGQGKENVRNYLKENKALAEDIENRVKAAYGISGAQPVEDAPASGKKES